MRIGEVSNKIEIETLIDDSVVSEAGFYNAILDGVAAAAV
jgi:hypothetical protein